MMALNQIMSIIDAEFAQIMLPVGKLPDAVEKKRTAICAENLRIFINKYIDYKEKMQMELIEDLSSKQQE